MLNETGDTTITWTEESDDQMRAIIEKKMAAGVTFFIIEPRFFGTLPPKKTRVASADGAFRHRALSIPDEELSRFVESGAGALVKTPDSPVQSIRKAKSATDVASGHSVGVRQMVGG